MRAAASSTARGRLSSRAQSSAISSLGFDLRPLAEEGDGLRLGERRHRVLDLALDAQELAAGDEEGRGWDMPRGARESSGAASITCSRLSTRRSMLPLADVLGELRPWHRGSGQIVSVTRAGSRREASPTQKTPALYSGTRRRRPPRAQVGVLPEPPGPVRVRRRAPRCDAREHLGELRLAARRSELAGRGKVRVRDRLERPGRSRPRAGRSRPRSAMSFNRCSPRSVSGRSTRAAVRPRAGRPARRGPSAGDAGAEVDVVSDVALARSEAASPCAGRSAPGSGRRRAPRVIASAAASAPGAVGKAKKKASPCVSTSTPSRERTPRGSGAGARRAHPRSPRRRARAAASSSPRRP